jgi:fermentation-respiration switch protein FrsA (DUF1100 family)
MGIPVQWIAVGLGVGYLFSNGTLTWKNVLGFSVVVASGMAFLLYRFQENLLFQPKIFPQHLTPKDNPPGMRHPGEHGLGWEDVRLTAADGTKLHAWLIRPENTAARQARATMLFFHENAGNMGLRMESLKMMYDTLNVNILILSYRGYGESEGVPNEEGLYQDAEAAFQYVRARSDLDTSRLVLFGRSLGGGVAIDLASKHERTGGISCIIVENTFASISDMVDVIFPALSFAKAAILRMKWDSRIKVASITRPILFLSGAQVSSHADKHLHLFSLHFYT